MSSYVLKVVGVVFISIIVDLILPNGKMEKYVKSVMALVIVFVIISPIPSVIASVKNYNFQTSESLIDYAFVKKTNLKKIDNLEKVLVDELEKQGISNVKIEFLTDQSKTDLVYLFANVDLKNVVLNQEAKGINIKEKTSELILKYIDLKKENILFYE